MLKDKMEEDLSDSEPVGNCSDTEDQEENKENEQRTSEESSESPIAHINKLEHSKRKREEDILSQETGSLEKLTCTLDKLQKQSVLTSHSSNIIDTRNANNEESGEPSLGELFGYRRPVKTRKLDSHASESLRENVGAKESIVQPVEVADIDSGYLSDTEMSTDGDTPTPAQSGAARLVPPSSGGNLPHMQGSAAGTKV